MEELINCEIPDELQTITWSGTGEAEQIVKAQIPIDDKVILVLACDWSLELLRRNRTVAGDGTFSIAPPMFDQAFVLATDRYGVLWPCIICLMPTRSKSAYVAVLSWCRDNGIIVESWLGDFERASIEVKYICNIILKISNYRQSRTSFQAAESSCVIFI